MKEQYGIRIRSDTDSNGRSGGSTAASSNGGSLVETTMIYLATVFIGTIVVACIEHLRQ